MLEIVTSKSIQVAPNLVVATVPTAINFAAWADKAVLYAAKQPYHSKLLGYSRDCPTDNPEYFFAERGNQLYLNLVDAASASLIPSRVINAALDFLDRQVPQRPTLIVCNQGCSRSPALAMFYMARHGLLPNDFFKAELAFKKLYPTYAPSGGMRGYGINHWKEILQVPVDKFLTDEKLTDLRNRVNKPWAIGRPELESSLDHIETVNRLTHELLQALATQPNSARVKTAIARINSIGIK